MVDYATKEALAQALSPTALTASGAAAFALTNTELDGLMISLAGVGQLSLLRSLLVPISNEDPFTRLAWSFIMDWGAVVSSVGQRGDPDTVQIDIPTMNGTIPAALGALQQTIPHILAAPLNTPQERAAAATAIQASLGGIVQSAGGIVGALQSLAGALATVAQDASHLVAPLSASPSLFAAPSSALPYEWLAQVGGRIAGEMTRSLAGAQSAAEHLEGILRATASDLSDCAGSIRDVIAWLGAPPDAWAALLALSVEVAAESWASLREEASALCGQLNTLYGVFCLCMATDI